MNQQYSEVVSVARDYYNSDDADNFYYLIWGGEDIHIGMYQSPDEPIFDASRRTVAALAEKATRLDSSKKVLDLGAGFGGAARYLASKFGCQVVALNLSEKENERDRQLNKQQNLANLIEVVDASFENVPYPDASFDLVWSQDAILHSGHRDQVIAEAARVLKPGGEMIFSDIVQTDDCPEGVLQPIYDRINLTSLGSPSFYRNAAQQNGLEVVAVEEHTEQLITHYARVKQETEQRQDELQGHVSQDYLERMKVGLQHWVDGGRKAQIAWCFFHFRKPQA